MPTRRVLVVWTHKLFRDSVRLLLDSPEIVWLGATSNYVEAKNQILDLIPDAVIIEEINEGTSSMVLDIVKTCAASVSIVGLSLSDNQFNIYRHHQQEFGKAEDLLNLLLVEPISGG